MNQGDNKYCCEDCICVECKTAMVKDITLDNIDFLFDLIPPEFIDSLGREYYHGIYSCKKEDEPTGALIWRLENMSEPDR